MIAPSNLPRVLYIGDVPVESSVAGAMLLYRLLLHYPADRLVVVQSEDSRIIHGPRLPGVRYETYHQPWDWSTYTRFNRVGGSIRYFAAKRRATEVVELAAGFDAQVVLTVAHGYTWITAAAFARRQRLPLHLIVHDHVPDTVNVPAAIGRQVWRTFKAAYVEAASRWCISPNMAEAYGVLGKPANVLFPIRSSILPAYDSPPQRLKSRSAPLVFGYLGSIGSGAYAGMLAKLAQVIEPSGGRLVLYAGPNPPRSLTVHHNVDSRGFVPQAQVLSVLRDNVDVLVLPMSFDPLDRRNVEFSFPTKVTDYTAACLPILVWGPSYSSIVRWAEANPGTADIVLDESITAIDGAAKRMSDPEWRWRLALTAASVGTAFFSHDILAPRFLDSIARARNP
jgi:hypothetical protein